MSQTTMEVFPAQIEDTTSDLLPCPESIISNQGTSSPTLRLVGHASAPPAYSTATPSSPSKRSSRQPRSLWSQIKLWRYRFELTFGPYVMDTSEKIAFYIVVLGMLAATVFLTIWSCSTFVRFISCSIASQLKSPLAVKDGAIWSMAIDMVERDQLGMYLLSESAVNGTLRVP